MSLVCELMLMILPCRRSIMPGASAWAIRNGARRLTAWTRSQCSAVHLQHRLDHRDAGIVDQDVDPAPGVQRLPAPRRAARRPSPCPPRSPGSAGPRPRLPARASSSPPRSRATAATSAPASASTRQISSPIPFDAPVTSARLPVSENRSTNAPATSALPVGRWRRLSPATPRSSRGCRAAREPEGGLRPSAAGAGQLRQIRAARPELGVHDLVERVGASGRERGVGRLVSAIAPCRATS